MHHLLKSPAALECKYWKTVDIPGADRSSGKGTYVILERLLGSTLMIILSKMDYLMLQKLDP